jgi:phosphoribosylformimino-5-aminoimidazole carboxamide ribotide isomerase
MALELYPAVDIRGGKAVRLTQGDFAREQVYDADPLEAARRWVDAGARRLHVVDLDGAKDGAARNLGQLERIARESNVPVQYGGGLRSMEEAEAALEHAARIVLGTAAFLDPSLLEALLGEYPERIAVGIDVRGGRVAIRGWRERTDASPEEAVAHLVERGVRTIVYTKVDWDGTMQGVDLVAARRLMDAAQGAELVYSGGIGSLDDLRQLRSMEAPNLAGVIVGKALYEGRFTVEEARAVL